MIPMNIYSKAVDAIGPSSVNKIVPVAAVAVVTGAFHVLGLDFADEFAKVSPILAGLGVYAAPANG